jgi:hypothetical protein
MGFPCAGEFGVVHFGNTCPEFGFFGFGHGSADKCPQFIQQALLGFFQAIVFNH